MVAVRALPEMIGPWPLRVARDGRRRSAALYLSDDRHVELRAPSHVSDEFLLKFLEDKRRWLERNIREREALDAIVPLSRRYVDGERFLYLGRRLRLRLVGGALFGPPLIEARDGELRLGLSAEEGAATDNIRKRLEEWYAQRADDEFRMRVARWGEAMGLRPRKIQVRPLKSLWGSCSAKGDLSFNSHLVKAPPAIIDYIVVHELAHIAHRDHSAAFWSLVERFYPQADRARRRLNRYGSALLR